MKYINLDREWDFRKGFFLGSAGQLSGPGNMVNLPHDGMIGTKTFPDAPTRTDTGYFVGNYANYTKFVMIPKEWENECVGLQFDGVMLNATVDVNGGKVALQHYGYSPFYVDLTNYIKFGEVNRITVNVNANMIQFTRWYPGYGIYRSASLCHSPRVHIVPNGIFVYTKYVANGHAFLESQVEIENSTLENRLVGVTVYVIKDKDNEIVTSSKRIIQVNPGKKETARISLTVKDPMLWDSDNPNLYRIKAEAEDLGVFRTHFEKGETSTVDEAETLFGIRTITADSVCGLRINGKEVKLKGGCVHHDNGLLGSVSLYETEARKVRKLKEVGFNAIRTAHNPPSSALIEACDREGMYVFAEAFDTWGMVKQSGDYNLYFASDWERDITAFVRRDRNHPSVIIWSTGNEIPERCGLNNGYTLATQIADTIRKNDGTRPISNGICSVWNGLDDDLAKGKSQIQNSRDGLDSREWEAVTEPYTNGLDIVGYNYMEDIYERDHEMFPERVILGSENFPKEIGFRWPLVERLPYVIGDFTWTAWDYMGESGLGKAVYLSPDDPKSNMSPWELMPAPTSPFPWRTSNDADFDITGHRRPQGSYRSVVWGSDKTYLYSMHPDNFGKVEITSMWGFPNLLSNWSYHGCEGRSLELVVFSRADEVEIFVNGTSLGRKAVVKDGCMPNSVRFETVFVPGKVEAVSYGDGKEISRDMLETAGMAAKIRLSPEKAVMKADGHDLIYVAVEIIDENGLLVPDAAVELKAEVSGAGILSGFGSGNPITDENYADNEATTFRGSAMAIIRSGYEAGKVKLVVSTEGLVPETVILDAE